MAMPIMLAPAMSQSRRTGPCTSLTRVTSVMLRNDAAAATTNESTTSQASYSPVIGGPHSLQALNASRMPADGATDETTLMS